MDLYKSYRRFRQFGGVRLLREYRRLGLLRPIAKRLVGCVVHGKSPKSIYPLIEAKVMPALFRRYGGFVDERIAFHKTRSGDGSLPGGGLPDAAAAGGGCRIWVCWFQGWDRAPRVVKTCLESVRRNMGEAEIVCLDDANLADWIELPHYVIEKYRGGIIPPAMYADIVRLELLVKWGGVWADASVYLSDALPQDIMDAPLFFPRYETKEGKFAGIGSWLISAAAGNIALKVLCDVLERYWQDYDCAVDYYIIHRFFNYIARRIPGTVEAMPRYLCAPALRLSKCLEKPKMINPELELALAGSSFHKLSPRMTNTEAIAILTDI